MITEREIDSILRESPLYEEANKKQLQDEVNFCINCIDGETQKKGEKMEEVN